MQQQQPWMSSALLKMTAVVRVSESSATETGIPPDGKSKEPIDVAMELKMAVTPTSTQTTGEATVERLETNRNGKR
jgi:hypothetical protein